MRFLRLGVLLAAGLSGLGAAFVGQGPGQGPGRGRPGDDPGPPPRPPGVEGPADPDDFPPPPPPPPPGPPGGPLFRALDLDDDGEISAKEIAKAPEALAKVDRNKDGKITHDEVGPPRRRRPGPPGDGPPGDRPPGDGPPRGGRRPGPPVDGPPDR